MMLTLVYRFQFKVTSNGNTYKIRLIPLAKLSFFLCISSKIKKQSPCVYGGSYFVFRQMAIKTQSGKLFINFY